MKKILMALAITICSVGIANAQTAVVKSKPVQQKTIVTKSVNTSMPAQSPVTKTSTRVTTKTNHGKKPARVVVTSNSARPLKSDGTPDKRYKVNAGIKKDGTPDKRYKANKKP